MARTVTTDTVAFCVDQEFGANLNGNPAITVANEEIGYITSGDLNTRIDCWLLQSASLEFEGAITPLAESSPGELDNWQFGVSQNITVYQREASYGTAQPSTYQIVETIQYPPLPMRDGEPGDLPFSYTSVKDLQLNVKANLSDRSPEDDPKWVIPQMVGGGPLLTTGGPLSLTSWMVFARMATPRQIILLGRIDWSVHLDTQYVNGAPQFTANPVTQILGTTPLELTYDQYNIPPLNTGDVPDLREVIEANEYRQGLLTQGQQEIRKWVYTEEDQAVTYELREDPNQYLNWINGEPSLALS